VSTDYTAALWRAMDEGGPIVLRAFGVRNESLAAVNATPSGLLWVGERTTDDWHGMKSLVGGKSPIVNVSDYDVEVLNGLLEARRPQTKSKFFCIIDWIDESDLPERLPGWGPRSGTRYFPRALALTWIERRHRKIAKLTVDDAVSM
jgi:hypothetical protein